VPVSGEKPLGLGARVRLGAEILLSYMRARRELGKAPIDSVVEILRGAPPRYCPPASPSCTATVEQARRLGRAVATVLSLLPGDTRCLVRSLVLTRLLGRRGISARLVIGARSGPEFLAHAWVECGGLPVLHPGDGTFGRLVEL
jgi:Transglutaminase-like superfamily